MTSAGDLLSQRPHTDLPGDEDADFAEYDAAAQQDQQQQQGGEGDLGEVREQLNELLEDAEEDELSLSDFQRYWRRLQSMLLHHINEQWRLGGPVAETAAQVGTYVQSAQYMASHLTQLYAAKGLDVKFTPFLPGPGITERPGTPKERLYMRPAREQTEGAQLRRLNTLATTDLQLAKTRTLFSAFDEDQTVNRRPIRAWRRVTESEKPCALCMIAATQLYFTDDLMPIHDNCECDIEMADAFGISEHEAKYHHIGWVDRLLETGDQTKEIQSLADADSPLDDYVNLTRIDQHGELGPVLRWAGQKFTGPKDLPVPLPVRPVPTVSGPGTGHEARLRSNAARVAQQRRQKAEERAAAEARRPKPPATEQVKELRPRFPYSDEAMAKEDNHTTDANDKPLLSDEQRSLARDLATEIWRNGASIEPAITAAAMSSANSLGGKMSGLDFRLKTGPSLYRKIQAEAIGLANGEPVDETDIRRAAADIKDSVRYTAVMPAEGYWDKGNQLRKALESQGAKTIKDPVGIPLSGYRGRNMAFELHGTPFEMQVHTELGVATKDEAHKIYNDSRKLKAILEAKGIDPKSDPAYRKMFDDMQAKWDTMPIAKGTPVVDNEKDAKSGDPNKVLYVTKHTAYYGPTVPGGECALGCAEMLGRERVPSTAYGMDWLPDSPEVKIVAPARAVRDKAWNALPVETLPQGTPLKANEGTLKKKSIDKVVSGKEPFREGYVIKLLRTDDGQLHIVDGHTRVAMYHALDKDMPVRIMSQDEVDRNQPKWPNLTAAEENAVEHYVVGTPDDGSGSYNLNAVLRLKPEYVKPDNEYGEQVGLIDEALKKSTLDEPIVVRRIVTGQKRNIRAEILAHADDPNYRIVEKGYSSTSRGDATSLADEFNFYAKASGGRAAKPDISKAVVYEMHLPAGSHALDVGAGLRKGGYDFEDLTWQNEVLLPRDTSWRIDGVRIDKATGVPIVGLSPVSGVSS